MYMDTDMNPYRKKNPFTLQVLTFPMDHIPEGTKKGPVTMAIDNIRSPRLRLKMIRRWGEEKFLKDIIIIIEIAKEAIMDMDAVHICTE